MARLTATQMELLRSLPGLGKEWLNIDTWSKRRKSQVFTLEARGMTTVWYYDGELHARQSLDGARFLAARRNPEGTAA